MQHPETEPSLLDPSRPGTPDSQLTNSLYRANATIDDLTTTLTKISRAPTPDDLKLLHCCCGKADCENTKAWTAFQTKLESRLILCAEVGQALLEKHEAYVRRHGGPDEDVESDDESRLSIPSRPDTPTARFSQVYQHDIQHDARVAHLMKENLALEKRLNTALLHTEVAESSNKTVTKELEEAKETISRLNLSQAKSTGWETRLGMALQDSEDLRQELDTERQRGKMVHAQLIAMKERCLKHQMEIKRLNEELEEQKQTRRELAEEILRDARARLEMIQQTQIGHTVNSESPEVTQVMESLVADNEALKRDIAELQNLLAESREDVRMLREELEESKALVPSGPEDKSRVFSSPFKPGHRGHMSSWASSFGSAPLSPLWNNTGEVPRGHSRTTTPFKPPYEPLTPTTEQRPLSPADSTLQTERLLPSFTSPRPNYPPSHMTIDTDKRSSNVKSPATPDRKSPRRPLLLLTQNKGVQTDAVNWANLLSPSPYTRSQTYDDSSCATPPNDGRSESSSFIEGQSHSSTIAALVERVNSLFNRITQADARTLTNRLRRQHLAGDVAHLSRATVSAILAEVNSLRSQFRAVLEDDKVISTCTRRDLRTLLSLFREMFSELGQMRITLNDVILDPTVAPKVSALAMDDPKSTEEARGRAAARGGNMLGGWMAPISKLFGAPTSAYPDSKVTNGSTDQSSRSTTVPSLLAPATKQKPTRLIPKIAPALGASATTVNVEFSGGGVGRSTSSALTVNSAEEAILRSATPAPPAGSSSRTVMDIFAGAPRPPEGDAWIVINAKPQRRLRPAPSAANLGSATMSRAAGRKMGSTRLPRNVDAVIDSESVVHDSDDENEPRHITTDRLLERTLRPRGLSDSSIHSTFMAGEESAGSSQIQPTLLPPHAVLDGGSSSRQGAYPGQPPSRSSVLHALSKKVQAFKSPPPSVAPSEASFSPESRSAIRAISPRRMNILPSLAGWAATQAGLDSEARESFIGSLREEEPHFGHRQWKVDMQGRDI